MHNAEFNQALLKASEDQAFHPDISFWRSAVQKNEEIRSNEREQLDTALKNRYENNPTVSKHAWLPKVFQPLFSIQRELGKPVKVGNEYKNPAFSNLATVDYLHTYVWGTITLGFFHGTGKQFNTEEKKKYKTHIDDNGLYQIIENKKRYIANGEYRYIISPKGGLYILTDYEKNTFHNSIRASQPVQCAGGITIIDGEIYGINNASGHYKPTLTHLLKAIGGLYAAGFISNVEAHVQCLDLKSWSPSLISIGKIGDLIRAGEIKIPHAWTATQDIHDKMRSL